MPKCGSLALATDWAPALALRLLVGESVPPPPASGLRLVPLMPPQPSALQLLASRVVLARPSPSPEIPPVRKDSTPAPGLWCLAHSSLVSPPVSAVAQA